MNFFFFFEDEHGAGAALGDTATPGIRDGPRNSKGLPPRAGGLGGCFSLLGGVNSTEEAGVVWTDLSGAGFCGEELPLHPENGRALEIGWPRLSKEMPPRAGGFGGRFWLLGGSTQRRKQA
jgi:hypothetical protein